ncbi:homogentisate 1,2-dioxygenase [Bradymonadaceae bacterium TMQ3]|nr:homogentisate 1,2-dioxygenase [Bradymonadaceae bacterium TMQ3]TXC75048.1 homogentisate 1,2-dioxygenase [Bradymonadales bacterium TMQ1]
MTLEYMTGFGNDFETEALEGALPRGRNSPQRAPYGLYAEQLSGSPFTAPRSANERSWLYRIRPSVRHMGEYEPVEVAHWLSAPTTAGGGLPIGQRRWDPVAIPEEPTGFVDGVRTISTAGDVVGQTGMSAHLYLVNRSSEDDYVINADGELMFLPQEGSIRLVSELGVLEVEPGELAVIPRGMAFRFELVDGPVRGYLCENYGGKFTLPERGPIGANCMANARDFKYPVAYFEDVERPSTIHIKWCGRHYVTAIGHSPLDVVAWHGNYAPYKYDLRDYSPIGAILFDHPDPSIFTVLTSPSGEAGTANIDFVIFSDRWLVGEDTFRPPWYHRNIMSEFMGLIYGQYDAKEEGFLPGGMSLHNMMLPHGPDTDAFEKASRAELKPQKLEGTMAFMLETRLPQHLTDYAAGLKTMQKDYIDCWKGLKKRFDGTIEGDWS